METPQGSEGDRKKIKKCKGGPLSKAMNTTRGREAKTVSRYSQIWTNERRNRWKDKSRPMWGRIWVSGSILHVQESSISAATLLELWMCSAMCIQAHVCEFAWANATCWWSMLIIYESFNMTDGQNIIRKKGSWMIGERKHEYYMYVTVLSDLSCWQHKINSIPF